jgi:hypothetical protein
MGWQATTIQLSYEFAKILPASDPDYQAYQQFKEKFGEDGSVMFIGIQDSSMLQLNKYNAWWKLGEDIRKIDGIEAVVSTARLYCLQRNDSLQKFEMKLLKDGPAANQTELDSIQNVIGNLPFYDGFILNKESHASLMAITFDNVKLNTKNRIDIVRTIQAKAKEFSSKNGVEVHLSGMPFIRTEITSKVVKEMKLFMLLAVLVTAIVLFVFFRSFQVVFFSLIVVAVGVVWSLGTIALLDYKITILSGLIPPLIIVIGIPNSILLLNKYQSEYARHNSQGIALSRMVHRIGLTTFLANVTTAIGFFVLYFTESRLLMEFGLVAAVNVMSTWLISLILIPIVFSFLSPPKVQHVKHLEAPRMQKLLTYVNSWVRFHTNKIYAVVIVITIISLYGMTKLDNVGYVVDDLPKNDPVYVDMKFFESNFKGVLPLEFSVSAKDSSNILDPKTLQKINRLEKELAKMPELSKPISVVDGIKYSYQSYQGGEKKYYILPGSMQLAEMSSYMGDQKGKSAMFKSFLDSNKMETRISVQMSDIGSKKMDVLLSQIRPKVDSIFPKEEYNTKITGNSLIFLKGNKYLFENLVESILLAIFLISIIMITLFMSFRMILISILPSLIPLIITAGLMGFFHVALKPSTILIFSIAFGIASDQTIYFLTKYRHEMRNSKVKSISKAVTDTIFESGLSMIYTAVILFFGFFIFSASGFGGTAALGKLLSTTLLMAMISNLILLPAFLVSLERRLTTKAFLSEPLFETDVEDDDIDHDELEIQKNDLV